MATVRRMPVHRTGRVWERLARDNALRAILDNPDGDSLDTFLATGERDVAAVFDALLGLGIDCPRHAALDFGCGVGRLTVPLASRFTQVIGVDASPTMIRLARDLTASAGFVNIDLRTKESPGVDVDSASQDFVISLITFQHVRPWMQAAYMAELARVLAPGGVGVVQVITGHADQPSSLVRRTYRRVVLQPWRSSLRGALHPWRARPHMYCVVTADLIAAASRESVEVVAAIDDHAAPGWVSQRLVLRPTERSGRPPSRNGPVGEDCAP